MSSEVYQNDTPDPIYNMGAYLVSTGVCCIQEASRRSPGPALKNWESKYKR